MRPIRILHLFGRLDRGGAETRTVEIMRHLAPTHEFAMDFVALSGRPGDWDTEIRRLGGRIHYVPLDWRIGPAFRAVLQGGQYDVVHSHVHYPSGYFLREAARMGIPVRIVHWRNTSDGKRRTLIRRLKLGLLRSWIDRYATTILAVAEGVMAEAWKSDWRLDARCRVVYNGVRAPTASWSHCKRRAIRESLGIDPGRRLIINVARFDRAKNQLQAVDILNALAAQSIDCHLLFVGRCDTAYGAEVRRWVNSLGLADRVTFVGLRTDVQRLLAAAEVMVFPSAWEGLPGAVLEAAAMGVPVVASDLPGCREIGSRVAHVTCVKTSATTENWAAAVRQALPGAIAGRDRRVRAFAESPFCLDKAAAAMADVWATPGVGIAL